MKKAGMTSGEARAEIRARRIQVRQRQAYPLEAVEPWHELTPDDYDFREWANGAKTSRLHAGCIYEYARESRKLRCLLALMDPKREREAWETISALPLPSSFRGLAQEKVEEALGGWLCCLADLAPYLNENVSFAHLYRTKRPELEKVFGGLDKQIRNEEGEPFPLLWNVTNSHRFLMRVPPILFGSESERHLATVRQSAMAGKRVMVPTGSDTWAELVTLKVRWGQFTDNEIVAAMKTFVAKWRPTDARCKTPNRQKDAIRRDRLLSWLDALSAMRLASYYPKSSPSSSLGSLVGRNENAVECFSRVRLSRIKSGKRKSPEDVSENHFSTQAVEAQRVFGETFSFLNHFPLSSQPENARTLTGRKRSTRIEKANHR